MCGGRDFDRAVVDQVVKPWLLNTFNLRENFAADPKYRTLVTMATWASERAKIELSAREEAVIAQAETELGIRDASGAEIYLDIPFSRQTLDGLIAAKVDESIQAARETLEKAGLSSQDIERIVFVGGPTHYKPMRDKVASELGIAAATDVNPMIAVAQGAAVFAESIDWSSQKRGRKSSRGTLTTGAGLDISFNFAARTPDVKAKLVVKVGGQAVAGAEFQIDSMDTGWSSGRVALRDGAMLNLPLGKPGDNVFKIFLFDGAGGPLSIENSRIVIARTAATIDAIPASSSIGIEALDKVGGRPILVYLVREGDALPKKGVKEFKAAELLKAGAAQSLLFRMWEGEIEEPVTDNRFVGVLEVRGTDFENNVIQAGATLVCEYEVLDSGNIVLKVSVPSIAGTFHSDRNFYSRQVGELDFLRAEKQVLEEVRQLQERAKTIAEKITDERIDQVFDKLDEAGKTGDHAGDPESAKQALDRVQEAKKLVAQVRKDNLPTMRQLDLDRCVGAFNNAVREHARPAEIAAFENLIRTAKRSIDKGSSEFENLLDEMRAKNFQILWRQDWFVADRFKWLAEEPWLFADRNEHAQLVQAGRVALQSDDFDKLRAIVSVMEMSRIGSGGAEDMLTMANIVRA
jgi:molecular chaperone DnaK